MTAKTKFILTYVGGIITGAILMIVVAYLMSRYNNVDPVDEVDQNVELYEKPQQVIKTHKLKVFQVLEDGSALARVELDMENPDDDNYGLVVLFLSDENSTYYDDQIISVPEGKCLRQVGTFHYMTRQNMEKTVPVVEIFDM